MSNAKEPWFVAERSEALAGLLLTSRKDVRVRHERKEDGRTEFLVEIGAEGELSTRIFVVQVKGTLASDPAEWMRDVPQLFPTHGVPPYLPSCVVVVNVRDNKAFYAWVAEPVAGANSAKLEFHEKGDFHPLDATAVDGIVDRVKEWYQALAKLLAPV